MPKMDEDVARAASIIIEQGPVRAPCRAAPRRNGLSLRAGARARARL